MIDFPSKSTLVPMNDIGKKIFSDILINRRDGNEFFAVT